MNKMHLDKSIRRVPDFPKPGIRFYDITSVLNDPAAFSYCIDELCRIVKASGANTVTAVEARGFVFAAPVARELGLPLVLIRKKGKLPNPVISTDFALEYGTDTICIQKIDLTPVRSFFVIDDLIATGGTLKAACKLIQDAGSEVKGIGAVIGLPFLGFREVLAPLEVHTLIDFHVE